MVALAKKVYFFIFAAFKCQKLFFHYGAGGHFGFPPLEKNAGIFARDTGAKYFLKGSRKSNQSSKHLSQKVVLKVFHPTSKFVHFFANCNVSVFKISILYTSYLFLYLTILGTES